MACESGIREISGITPDAIPPELLTATEPAVLRGLVAEWPCVRAAARGKAGIIEYLSGYCRDQDVLAFRGPAEIDGRFFYNEDLSGLNFERITTRLSAMLDRFAESEGGSDSACYYIGSTPVDACFPGFRSDNDIALGEAGPVVSFWMGQRTRIAAHFDSPSNVACVTAGRRRFTIFPPDQIGNLYVGPLDFTPAGQAISLVDFAQPDFQRFPRFQEALEHASVVELLPGDALYLPGMWWHHVEGLDDFNMLINYWWTAGGAHGGNPVNALIHALITIRELPPEQRDAWRTQFEYYIFDKDPGAFAHIPAERRGILGELDATAVGQLRAMLRNKLA
jgi:hypothetical protein